MANLPIGVCKKCGDYGEVEKHHFYPARWFGRKGSNRNNTKALCADCHKVANQITVEIDNQFNITCGDIAKRYRNVYYMQFMRFINSNSYPA